MRPESVRLVSEKEVCVEFVRLKPLLLLLNASSRNRMIRSLRDLSRWSIGADGLEDIVGIDGSLAHSRNRTETGQSSRVDERETACRVG